MVCSPKRLEWARRWRENNRQLIRQRRRAAYKANSTPFLDSSKKWRAKQPLKVKPPKKEPKKRKSNPAHLRKSRYGLTAEQYNDLLVAQGGRCAICKSDTLLQVDHDHTTDVVRGLLCRECNMGLGKFKDCVELLTRAINYLSLK